MALFHSDVGEVGSGRRWYSLVLNGEHKTEKEDKIGSSNIKLISTCSSISYHSSCFQHKIVDKILMKLLVKAKNQKLIEVPKKNNDPRSYQM